MKGFFNSIFNLESPVMLKASRIASLIWLNLLWLLCCLPIVTIGPATVALNYVIFQYHTGRSDLVLQPFFKSFRRDFKQGLLLGLPVTVLFAVLAFNALYIYGSHPEGFHPLWIPFIIMFLILGALITYGFPLIARYSLSFRDIFNNCLVFFIQNPLLSLRSLLLHMLPLLLWLFWPEVFWNTSFFWILLGGSLTAYLNDKALLRIFESEHEEDEDEV